jgi:NAD(P)-dependent dehydrogenase (short-subunit alcohol dehydrogenase family)
MASSRIILITGVTQGLGRAMLDEFIQAGHTVLGCGRSQENIDGLNQKYGRPHEFYSVDISSDAAVKVWARVCLNLYGPPDLLINNAGVINNNARLWDVKAKDFSEVIDVNLKGTANVIRHFLPAMMQRSNGVIVNFSSGWGRSTDANVAPYCASKWAIEGLTLSLAKELPPEMAAVPLNPGIINTEMLQTCFGSAADSYPSPAEWARAAVPFLLQLGPKDNGKQLEVPRDPSWKHPD